MGFSEEYFPYVKPFRILMVGLCESGKTSLLYRMKHRKSIPHRPARTATFNVSRFERSGFELEVWDINVGAGAGFVMQRHHYANSKAVIFVIDCAAPEKLQDAAESVVEVMSIGTLSGLPLVVFCNKCDRRGDEKGTKTLSLEEVEAAL